MEDITAATIADKAAKLRKGIVLWCAVNTHAHTTHTSHKYFLKKVKKISGRTDNRSSFHSAQESGQL